MALTKSPAPSGRHHALCFLVTVATLLLVKPHNPGLVMQDTLDGPDSYMTLLRMRDALDDERWFGNSVVRDASGNGMVPPWSHVMDGLILVLRAPLLLVLSPAAALFGGGGVTGPLSMGLLGLLCAWTAAPLASGEWLWTAAAAALAPPILNYGQFGDVTHHVPLVALAVGAWGAAGRASFGSVRAGWLAGLFAGLGLWVSPESMLYGMMAFGGIFVSWAARPTPGVAKALAAAGCCLLAVIASGLLLDPAHAGRSVPELDRLSAAFLALGLIVCAACWVPRAPCVARLMLAGRFALIAGIGMGGAALWLALFPAYLRGLAGLMTPDEAAAFFGGIQELRPLGMPGMFTLFALGGTLATLAASGFTIASFGVGQPRLLPRILWSYAAICGTASLAVAILH